MITFKTSPWRSILSFVLIINLFAFETWAQIPGASNGIASFGGGSEYFVGRIEGKPLITVDLLDGVHTPGVYHIPVQTNLAQLFSYAGGLTDAAQIDSVTVRNARGPSVSNAKYNLNDIMALNKPLPVLQDNDVVHVAVAQDSLPRTALWVSIITSVATVILTSLIISHDLKGN